MTQVSTQAELQEALRAQAEEIQVTADFDIAAQQTVTYSLLLRSAPSGPIHTLFKTAGFSGSLIRVSGGGALTLEDLVLDGSAAGSYEENPANRTLVQVAGGSVHLGSGSVLQNNSSYQEGGGLYLSGDASYVNALLMDGDAAIRGCNSRTSGGGVTAALRNNGDSVRLAGEALIEQNTAANGAGVYLRSYLAEVGGAVSIGERVRIRDNEAGGNGGGIYCSSFSTGGAPSLSLTLGGEADIASNRAASGGGVYFYSANPGDRLTLEGSIRVAENTVTGNGGGVYFNSDDGALFLSGDAKITDNQADAQASSFGGHGGGVCVVPGRVEIQDQVEISHNSAGRFGGGLSAAEESTVTMSGGSIHDNRSGQEGGGVWNHGGSRFTQTGGAIESNAASIGGGLYNDADSTASILGGAIRENTSTQSAPGVYNAGTLYAQGLRELTNGLYLENRGAAAYLSDALAEGTVLQLENSGYVAQNPAGVPIVVGEATPQYPRLTQMDANGFQKPPTGFDGWEIRLSEDSTQVLLAPEVYALRYENTMDGQNPNPRNYTVVTPTITLLPLADTPGDRFLGWFDAAEGGVQVTEIPLGRTGDKTLYARWEVLEYTLTYCGNEAGGPPVYCVPYPQQVTVGQYTQISCCMPCRDGCCFCGWNTSPDGTGQMLRPGQSIGPVTGDICLYAQWRSLFSPEPWADCPGGSG